MFLELIDDLETHLYRVSGFVCQLYKAFNWPHTIPLDFMSYFLAGKCDRSFTQGTAFLESVLIPLPTPYGKETLQWLYPSFWTEQTHRQNTMCFVLIPVFQCSVSNDSDWVLWGLTILRGGHPVDFFMITVRRFISWHVSSEAIITFLFALGISWFFSDSHI